MADDQRRTSARQRTVLRACVYYDKHSASADCLVRDMSGGGARLELSENVVIPDEIELYIPKKEKTFDARVLWRHGNEVGVAYADSGNGRDRDHGARNLEAPAERGGGGLELEDRVQKLEAEMASLKRMFLDDVKKRSLRLPL
jgi:PilZ domain